MKNAKTEAICNLLQQFSQDDRGSMTVWGLFVFFVSGILGALALDVTYLISARTQLQVAAEQAAHAAIYQRYLIDEDTQTEADARQMALELVTASLPASRYGKAIQITDIEYGTFNIASRVWTADDTSKSAARAVATFSRGRQNPAVTFLFRLIGRDDFNVSTEAIYVAYGKACLREGYVANGVVDIQSNNSFVDGFCVHSNSHVQVNQNNTFEPGTVVSMPNVADLGIPGGVRYDDAGEIDPDNFDGNEGLLDALTPGYIDLRILDRIANMIHANAGAYSPYDAVPNTAVWEDTDRDYPSYVMDEYQNPIQISAKTVTTAEILAAGAVSEEEALASREILGIDEEGTTIFGDPATPATDGKGRVYYIDDGSKPSKGKGQNVSTCSITINAKDAPLSEMIIVSPCEITFANGSAIEDARIFTSATTADSISAPNGLILGRSGSCANGAQLYTLGGMKFASGLEVHGSQLVANADIQFAANANGVTGASFIAGGKIDGTSNGDMGLCGDSMDDDTVELAYFRMAG